MIEPVIHRKKRVEIFNDRKPVVVETPKVKKVKKPKPEKVKKVKIPPPPPRVRQLPTPAHPDGSPETRVKLFMQMLETECPVFHNPTPMKIKIHKDIRERYPQIANHIICKTLHMYCKSVNYLRGLKSGASRYDLDMQPVDVVTEDQAATAKVALFKAMKQRIKAR